VRFCDISTLKVDYYQ